MLTKRSFALRACLVLAATFAGSSARANVSGFGGNGTGYTLNQLASGGLSVTNNVATLTTTTGNQATSIFYNQPQQIASFTATFTYNYTGVADGFTFTLQNDSRGVLALGGYGTALGYSAGANGTAINNSASVEFNIFNGQTTGFNTNGTSNRPNTYGNGLLTSTSFNITLSYNGTTLTERVNDGVATNTFTYAANLANILGSGTAYVGFTGGTGDSNSTQTISNFAFTSVPEPSTWAMLAAGGGLLLVGSYRRCRTGAATEA